MPLFEMRRFVIRQDQCLMKVTMDSCAFGAVAARWAQEPRRVLDIGTGTGLLALMFAQTHTATIDAVEIDAPTAIQAKENTQDWPTIRVVHRRIQDHHHHGIKYDFIVCNPPFYSNRRRKSTAAKHTEISLPPVDLIKAIDRLLSHQKGSMCALLWHPTEYKNLPRTSTLPLYQRTFFHDHVGGPSHVVANLYGRPPHRKDDTSDHIFYFEDPPSTFPRRMTAKFRELMDDYYTEATLGTARDPKT